MVGRDEREQALERTAFLDLFVPQQLLAMIANSSQLVVDFLRQLTGTGESINPTFQFGTIRELLLGKKPTHV